MRIHKKIKHLFKGFTLVELIVVISVLAVLASIAMSQVSNITAWARDSQRMTDMSAMKSSIELYKAKTGKLPIPTNGSGVTYSWALLWTQGTFGEPTWRQLSSITPKPVDPTNSIEYVYSVANNNREFELGGILEKATWFMSSILNEVLAASQNVTFIEWTYNGVSLKVETGSKTYVVAAPSLIGGYLGDAKMENTGLTIEGLWSLPKGFSWVVVSTANTGTFTPVIGWSGSKLPETSTGAEALIIGLQSAYSGSVATSLSQISSLVSATGSQITALGEGLVENALWGEISGQSSGEQTVAYCESPTVVTTLAGTGGLSGLMDGNKLTARFTNPYGISIDSAGNLYVADTWNHAIRKVTPDGTVTTIAGAYPTVTNSFLDGVGTAARFYNPRGIAVDKNGLIYVVDTTNNAIRKVTPNGTVTTIAGAYPTKASGLVDDIGTAARFNNPYGLTVDNDGIIYVADTNNGAIRKIATNGSVSTLVGSAGFGYLNGISTVAKMLGIQGITASPDGSLYIFEDAAKAVRKVTSTGTISSLAWAYPTITEGYSDGIGTAARFYGPWRGALDKNGNLYVADVYNYAIRKVTPNGTVTTIAGAYPNAISAHLDGTGTAARFTSPRDISIDTNGNLYVADGQTIRKISCQ